MKAQPSSRFQHPFAVALAGLALAASPLIAGIGGPYTADANTLHLWHLDEADPGPAAATGNGAIFDLTPSGGALLGAPSFAGFGTAGDTSGATAQGLQGVSIPVGSLTGVDGAFTFEAMIRTANVTSIQQIISMENASNSRFDHPFQFRLDSEVGAGGFATGTLRLINIASPTAVEQLVAEIPTSGPDAFVADEWFHVAVTYNGNEGTADNLKLYWTRVDPSRTQANEINSISMLADLSGINTVFGVANEYRAAQDNNLLGQIDEVRISDIARAPDDMLFRNTGPDTTAPTLSSTVPEDDAIGVPVGAALVARFDEPVQAGTGAITLKRSSDDMTVESFDVATAPSAQINFSGGNITLDPTLDLVGDVEYYVLIDATAVQDSSANPFAGIADPTAWSFTADGTAPGTSAMTPMADAADVPQTSTLSLSFGENVVAGSGSITLHLASDDSVVETIDVTDALAVMIAGGTVTIALPNPLAAVTAYYVNIAPGAFVDLSGNAFAGITDRTTWVFATAAIPEGLLFAHGFGGDTADLDGTLPDTTTAAAAWVASPNFNQDGSIDQGAGSATLAFTPSNGLVYTLEASFRGVSGNGNWFAFGFANGQSTGSTLNDRFINNNVVGKAWMLLKGDASASQNSALMNGTASNAALTTFTNENPGGDMDMRIVLDTTGGTGSWTATWFAKRPADLEYTEVRETTTLIAEDINSVGLALANAGVFGSIESFRLFTGDEPSAAFAITAISYSPDDKIVTLTWESTEGGSYIVKFSRDMSDWLGDLDDGVEADPGETTTRSYPVFGADQPDALFFRVERQ